MAHKDVHSYGQAQLVVDDDMTNFCSIVHDDDNLLRKCKIICTMGPSCWDVDMLVKLIDAGMNVCRLNFSHGDHEMHGQTVNRIREAAKLRKQKPVAILLDTKGPEIRTGFFREGVGKTIELKQGEELKLVTDYKFLGDSSCIALSYEGLCSSVQVGATILVADGSLSLTVKSIGEDHVITTIMNSCKLGERKNCNLPGNKVNLPVLQEKDIDDLLDFGVPQGVDFVAASFVQSAEDVQFIRSTLGLRGRSIKIISKIENSEGLKNFNEIMAASDAIMVARGDLGMEVPPEKVTIAQKMMIARCNWSGTPVITATQMLESMVNLPRPTRAEASDVTNAVLDGTDAVMLSGETAAGKFPCEAVTFMRKICQTAESLIDCSGMYSSMRVRVLQEFQHMPSPESVCSAAVKATIDSICTLIVVLTETGTTARLVAKYRPYVPILAITASGTTLRQLLLVRGVVPIMTASFVGTDAVVQKALTYAKDENMVKPGDSVVAVHGQREECAGQSNLLKIVTVP